MIVYSANNRAPQKASGAILTVVGIWTISVLLSFPLFFAMNLEVIPMPPQVVKIIQEDSIAYCAEKWGEYEKGRLVYSCFILLMQVKQQMSNSYMGMGSVLHKGGKTLTMAGRQGWG